MRLARLGTSASAQGVIGVRCEDFLYLVKRGLRLRAAVRLCGPRFAAVLGRPPHATRPRWPVGGFSLPGAEAVSRCAGQTGIRSSP